MRAEADLYRDYWDQFYANPHPELTEPSAFARFCADRITNGASVFELGCGNGRDALFFAKKGLAITACDQSSTAIRALAALSADQDGYAIRPTFVVRRFEDLVDGPPWDAIYSRFTLHTVDAPTASRTLAWAHRNLRPTGQLLIEARTVKDELFGKGEAAGRDAFIHDGHYRRFVRSDELAAELEAIGFEVELLQEGTGMATFGTDDPVVVRAVARPGRVEGSV